MLQLLSNRMNNRRESKFKKKNPIERESNSEIERITDSKTIKMIGKISKMQSKIRGKIKITEESIKNSIIKPLRGRLSITMKLNKKIQIKKEKNSKKDQRRIDIFPKKRIIKINGFLEGVNKR